MFEDKIALSANLTEEDCREIIRTAWGNKDTRNQSATSSTFGLQDYGNVCRAIAS